MAQTTILECDKCNKCTIDKIPRLYKNTMYYESDLNKLGMYTCKWGNVSSLLCNDCLKSFYELKQKQDNSLKEYLGSKT